MTNDEEQISWYERALPKPPVPDLNRTLDRYLEYASVVADGMGRPMTQTEKAVEKFRIEGIPFQKQLLDIAEKEKNWVNRFWLPEMYLRIRLPLPVNSSPAYIFPQRKFSSDDEMNRYAALLIRGIVDYKDSIDRKLVEREVSTGTQKVSMCMEQYDSVLGSYRMPGDPEDLLIRKPKLHRDNEHILAMCRDQAFVIHTRWQGKLLPLADILHQLKEVRKRAIVRANTVIPIGGAAGGDRTSAAEFWQEMSAVQENQISLSWARDAIFVICIDEVEESNENKLTLPDRGKHLLVGGGSRKFGFNRWYDSTIQVIVSRNGISGLCIEHSAAEGIVIINMAEYALRHVEKHWKERMICHEQRHFSPKPLTWHVSQLARKILEKQRKAFDELAMELDLDVVEFKDFGKEFMKQNSFSPDGFVQLAMQFAHYLTHDHLVSTYESASLRRFGSGRVDNIRANTPEALLWCRSMTSRGVDRATKLKFLRDAAAKQALVTKENISGEGIDNHLCALSVLARGTEQDIFSDPLWSELMRFPLSTSQVTTSPSISDCYLCYGAVVRDGYGCAYNLQKNHIIFAPSAFKSNPKTRLTEFSRRLVDALRLMAEVIDPKKEF